MEKNEYKCGMCGEIYQKGWSDEESAQEAKEIFGKPIEEWKDVAVVICDDCFQKIHPLKAATSHSTKIAAKMQNSGVLGL